MANVNNEASNPEIYMIQHAIHCPVNSLVFTSLRLLYKMHA